MLFSINRAESHLSAIIITEIISFDYVIYQLACTHKLTLYQFASLYGRGRVDDGDCNGIGHLAVSTKVNFLVEIAPFD